MTMATWNDDSLRSLGMLLLGHCSQIDEFGACIIGDNLLVLMNADTKPIPFTMPKAVKRLRHLDRLFDTFHGNTEILQFDTSAAYLLQPQSMALFRHKNGA